MSIYLDNTYGSGSARVSRWCGEALVMLSILRYKNTFARRGKRDPFLIILNLLDATADFSNAWTEGSGCPNVHAAYIMTSANPDSIIEENSAKFCSTRAPA